MYTLVIPSFSIFRANSLSVTSLSRDVLLSSAALIFWLHATSSFLRFSTLDAWSATCCFSCFSFYTDSFWTSFAALSVFLTKSSFSLMSESILVLLEVSNFLRLSWLLVISSLCLSTVSLAEVSNFLDSSFSLVRVSIFCLLMELSFTCLDA